MSRPLRIQEYVTVRLPDNHTVVNHSAQWVSAGTHMAHSPMPIIGCSENLAQQVGQRDMPLPAQQHFFAFAWRWMIGLVNRVKRSRGAPPGHGHGQQDMPIQVGLQAIGNVHRYAGEKFAASLEVAQALFQRDDDTLHRSLALEMALHHLTSAYLQSMLAVADEAGAEIMARLERPLASFGIEERRQIDQVSEAYLQDVQDILQRKENVDDEKGVKPFGVGPTNPIR